MKSLQNFQITFSRFEKVRWIFYFDETKFSSTKECKSMIGENEKDNRRARMYESSSLHQTFRDGSFNLSGGFTRVTYLATIKRIGRAD